MVDVVLPIREFYACFPSSVFFLDIEIDLMGGEKRTASGYGFVDCVAVQEVVGGTVAPYFGNGAADGKRQLVGLYNVLVKEHSFNILAVPRHIATAVLLSFDAFCKIQIVKILLRVEAGNIQPEVGLEFVLGIDVEGGT